MSVGQRSSVRLLARVRVQSASVVVACAGIAWAALCVWLAHDGHAPSRTLLPIDRDRYYLAQAAFVLPLLFLQWLVCTHVADHVARGLGGRHGQRRALFAGLGIALGAPLLLLFVLPDAIVYGLWGFSALGPLVRVTAPFSFALSLLLATLTLRSTHALSTWRALVAALSGLVAQALLGAPLLR